jgi:hypothetical protein
MQSRELCDSVESSSRLKCLIERDLAARVLPEGKLFGIRRRRCATRALRVQIMLEWRGINRQAARAADASKAATKSATE